MDTTDPRAVVPAGFAREYELLADEAPKDDKFKIATQSLYVCECGKHIANANEYNIARHKSSKRHAEALTNSDSEFFLCECGKRLLRSQKENEDNMAQHRASRKHIQAMAKKQKLVHPQADLSFYSRPDDTASVWTSTIQSVRSHVVSLDLIKEAEDELMRGLASLEQEYQRTSALLTMLEKAQQKAHQRAEKLQSENLTMKASVVTILQNRDQELKLLKNIADMN
ncbi:hypothetical protein Ae201684P_005976 [Aphanomyces euteiches]|uniref:Uncharacterized protein n=1 Tax=Aphanomyces euteiches TaxID=100861 RepID=A0A6G0WW37_9STRA|nr:hypothetical protein Ae201684_011004 [Aphanomyces euteiches]KAH9058634.1 hypothetical protein Ae201684P_005976 [Aphanomyces euteiches]